MAIRWRFARLSTSSLPWPVNGPRQSISNSIYLKRGTIMALAAGTYAVFTTSEGKITVRLFEAEAPITVKNFIELAEGSKEWSHPVTRAKSKDKLYHGTIFHRVIPDFMIQGGDPAGTGMGGPGYRFEDETRGS